MSALHLRKSLVIRALLVDYRARSEKIDQGLLNAFAQGVVLDGDERRTVDQRLLEPELFFVLLDSAAEISGLADVDRVIIPIVENVDTGADWNVIHRVRIEVFEDADTGESFTLFSLALELRWWKDAEGIGQSLECGFAREPRTPGLDRLDGRHACFRGVCKRFDRPSIANACLIEPSADWGGLCRISASDGFCRHRLILWYRWR